MANERLSIPEVLARVDYRAVMEDMGFKLPPTDNNGMVWIRCPIHKWKSKCKKGEVVDDVRFGMFVRDGTVKCMLCLYHTTFPKFMTDYLHLTPDQVFQRLRAYAEKKE